MIKPWRRGRNSHLGDDQFHRDDFTIDYVNRTVTCPQARTVNITNAGNAVFGTRCLSCPSMNRCTIDKAGKTMKIGDHDQSSA